MFLIVALFNIPGGRERNQSKTELEIEIVMFQVQTDRKNGGDPKEDIKLAVYRKKIGQESQELVFEGRADEKGRFVIPEFVVPSIVTIKVTDSRYPPVEVSAKVLNGNTALITMEV